MLDLNLDMVSRESSSASSFCDDEKTKKMMMSEDVAGDHLNLVQEAFSKTQMEDSGTSNSSIIINCEEPPANAGDENSSNNTTSAFIFDIMKKDVVRSTTTTTAAAATHHHVEEGHDMSPPPAAPLMTRQLFSVAGEAQPMMITTTPGQWLNLCEAEPTSGEQELRAVQQKQQQVKKSRRGPRSRSSQYRGVTFYRRTSRWESHIW